MNNERLTQSAPENLSNPELGRRSLPRIFVEVIEKYGLEYPKGYEPVFDISKYRENNPSEPDVLTEKIDSPFTEIDLLKLTERVNIQIVPDQELIENSDAKEIVQDVVIEPKSNPELAKLVKITDEKDPIVGEKAVSLTDHDFVKLDENVKSVDEKAAISTVLLGKKSKYGIVSFNEGLRGVKNRTSKSIDGFIRLSAEKIGAFNRAFYRKTVKVAPAVFAASIGIILGVRGADKVQDWSDEKRYENSIELEQSNMYVYDQIEESPDNSVIGEPIVIDSPANSEVTSSNQSNSNEQSGPANEQQADQDVQTEIEVVVSQKSPSLLKAVYTGEIELQETAARQIATIEIPKMCLDDIKVYGSNKYDLEDPIFLNALESQGVITAEERGRLEAKNITNKLRADILQRVDRIYEVNIDETPQEACADVGTAEYPARWSRTPQGSTVAEYVAAAGLGLGDIQPVVDLDWQGVAPGQVGNGLISGHRTTESAPFANIDALQAGDEILIHGDNNKIYRYIVEKTEVVNPDFVEWSYFLNYSSPYSNKTLTMYTCDDDGSTRYIVRAVLESESITV